jgi:DNA-binding GntR family transcriptional regulator
MWIASSLPYLSPRRAGQVDAWSQEAAETGRVGTQKIREVGERVPPAEVSAALGLPDGASAVVRRRTILLDDRPVEQADSWYPTGIADGTRQYHDQDSPHERKTNPNGHPQTTRE